MSVAVIEWAPIGAVSDAIAALSCGQGKVSPLSEAHHDDGTSLVTLHACFEGFEAVGYGQALVMLLPGHEFALDGWIARDARFVGTELAMRSGAPTLTLRLLLTLEPVG